MKEARAVKIQLKKTNNHASFGGSLLKNNMDVEAVVEMQRNLHLRARPVTVGAMSVVRVSASHNGLVAVCAQCAADGC
jgi:NAD kinase